MRCSRSYITNSLEAGTAQSPCDRIIGAERKPRQRSDCLSFFSILNDAASCASRQRACADCCPGNRRIDDEALSFEQCADAAQHCGFATEQMRASADIEKQTIRR